MSTFSMRRNAAKRSTPVLGLALAGHWFLLTPAVLLVVLPAVVLLSFVAPAFARRAFDWVVKPVSWSDTMAREFGRRFNQSV